MGLTNQQDTKKLKTRLKLGTYILFAIGITIFLTQQFLFDFYPELPADSLNIVALVITASGFIFYGIATEIIKRKCNNPQDNRIPTE